MQQKILCSRTQQLLLGLLHLSELATSLNFVFAAVPTEVTAVMQTTTIKASITAYSTAVGPSSETRNLFTLAANFDIFIVLRGEPDHGQSLHGGFPPLTER